MHPLGVHGDHCTLYLDLDEVSRRFLCHERVIPRIFECTSFSRSDEWCTRLTEPESFTMSAASFPQNQYWASYSDEHGDFDPQIRLVYSLRHSTELDIRMNTETFSLRLFSMRSQLYEEVMTCLPSCRGTSFSTRIRRSLSSLASHYRWQTPSSREIEFVNRDSSPG